MVYIDVLRRDENMYYLFCKIYCIDCIDTLIVNVWTANRI